MCMLAAQLYINAAFVCIGAMEISIATMCKKDRASETEVYVFAFVPSHQLPKRFPSALDPFLEPFVRDVEVIFIEGVLCVLRTQVDVHSLPSCVTHAGVEVQYAASVPGFSDGVSGTALIRCLLLLWTGDYPAQCEVGKTIFNGMYPCRRCKIRGTCTYMTACTVT